MKAYDESYSKIITGHKYKDKDNDKDNDNDKDKYTVSGFFLIKYFNSSLEKIGLRIGLGTLPKAQRT